ncbi:MAG: sulfotransferase domain-containing protein [Flavobacteriaceae bacterium]|nr:sulfotransferase domain-containing protein [Flavobacteriaceae bacterium]
MKIHNNKEVLLPDFLIVGAAKSGTTSLFHHIGKSEQIFFSKEKEPHFFSFYNSPPSFTSPEKLPTVISDISKYSKLFEKASENQLLGEASQSYLYMYETVIKNMYELYGNKARQVKIIIILRNPIERAWSQYWHFKKNFNETVDFLTAIKKETISMRKKTNWNIFYDYVGFGNYTQQIKAYQENFDNVKIFLFDDLKIDTESVIKQLCNFLCIEEIENDFTRKYNPSGLPKKNLYGFLWKLNTTSKKLTSIKNILPYKLKKIISNGILENALEKQVLPLEDTEFLKSVYFEEINDLYENLKRKQIKEWLE